MLGGGTLGKNVLGGGVFGGSVFGGGMLGGSVFGGGVLGGYSLLNCCRMYSTVRCVDSSIKTASYTKLLLISSTSVSGRVVVMVKSSASSKFLVITLDNVEVPPTSIFKVTNTLAARTDICTLLVEM